MRPVARSDADLGGLSVKIVVIVGAGASVAEAMSHRPKRTRLHPPVDANFFSKARNLGAGVPILRRAALAADLGDPFGGSEPRMEEFFGDVYYEVLEAADPTHSPALDAYRALLRSYTRTLAETTAWFHDRPLGAIGRWFRQLLAVADLERLTIVTFNHDLVLENVLIQLPRAQRWCVDEGYGPIKLSPTKSARPGLRMPRHDPRVCDHSIPIELLKLHGSLNWQVRTLSHEPSLYDLFPKADTNAKIECITDRVPSVTLQRKIGKRKWKLWPQIIPPVYGKQAAIGGRFGALWTRASDAIRVADRLIVAGYSMPVTDVHTEKMLSRCIVSNTALKDIEVVNPDASAAERFAQVARADRVGWYRDLAHFQG